MSTQRDVYIELSLRLTFMDLNYSKYKQRSECPHKTLLMLNSNVNLFFGSLFLLIVTN